MPVSEGAGSPQSPLAKGAALYNKGDFAEAKKILLQEYMMAPQNPSLSYYFAIILIETGKEYEARTVLIHLFNGGSEYKYDAAFYVGLSFVKQGDNRQAVEWLKKIPADHPQFRKAQSLIAELK
jgi:tetratricopeptide (TPR) repeat protein